MSNMSPMLLIDALPLTSGATCSQNICVGLLGPTARDRARKTIKDAYEYLADQMPACLWERCELKAINLLVICGPLPVQIR